MRIAYVSLHWPRTRNSGVGKKIHSQLEAWAALGHETCLFMHTSTYSPLSDLVPGRVFSFETDGKITTEMNRIRAAGELISAVKEFHPEAIYLRYGIYTYPLHQLTDIAPTVEEINTNDVAQHAELGMLIALYNRMTRGLILERVRALVTVSRELADSQVFISYQKPTCVISNGVDLGKYDILPAPANPHPRLVFLGTPGYNWHGVDKLVLLARMFPDLQIDIVGYNQLPDQEPYPKNITLHGYLSSEEYLKLLARADIAISSLALHRKNLEEASPLKSREYLALGIPLVVAYLDTDLGQSNLDFLMKIPNREDNIKTHGRLIHDFAYAMRGKRVDRKKIAKIDLKYKELERINFITGILQNG